MSRLIPTIALVAAALFAGCNDGGKASTVDADPTIDAPPDRCGPTTTVGYQKVCVLGSNDECGTCECRMMEHAPLCIPTCTTEADCPQPSRGCGTDGYCRD
ncbi:MAG TPA: hypothetical protein VGM90_31030 [Kofleriaceae bacterium]